MPGFYFDQRWCIQHGIGRFATEIRRRLLGWNDVPIDGYPTNPLDALKLGRCLRRQNAKLFFSPGFNVPAWSICPTVCTIHDLIHVHYPTQRSKLTLAYYRWFQRPIVRRSPLTLTVSKFSREQVLEWYGLNDEQVVCVGNGVSDEFKPDGPMIQCDRPFFLYVGNTRPHKNIDVLLRAMTEIDAEATLTMVLKPDEGLHQRIATLGLGDRVTFATGLSDSQLAEYYRAAVATILPSHFEGFGLPLVEAMACGCPVIGANRTSIPEVIGDAGRLFEANDSEGLTDLMAQILCGSVETEAMIGRGLTQARKFQWADVTKRVEQALKIVTGDK